MLKRLIHQKLFFLSDTLKDHELSNYITGYPVKSSYLVKESKSYKFLPINEQKRS